MYYSIKRFFDFIFSLLGLVVASPVFIFVGIALYIQNSGDFFFIQLRPGRGGKVFALYKFKTMTDERDANGQLLKDEYRLTKIGKFIRTTSLDELPQLLNVLKGNMSLVGPRPLLVKYLPLYNERQARRHEVKPGITGWAQVNGRNAISWKERFELDVYYVENQSFQLDLKILWMTITKVIKREGVSSQTSVTMEPFTGN
jgi:lipopolysaccharide/colanic/teichoic acid biosynthesis glycosyltransferase